MKNGEIEQSVQQSVNFNDTKCKTLETNFVLAALSLHSSASLGAYTFERHLRNRFGATTYLIGYERKVPSKVIPTNILTISTFELSLTFKKNREISISHCNNNLRNIRYELQSLINSSLIQCHNPQHRH